MPMHLAILASQCQLGSVCNASLNANLQEYRRMDKMLAAPSLGRRRSRGASLLPRITSWLAVLMEVPRCALPSNRGRSIMFVLSLHLGNESVQAYVQQDADGANPTQRKRRSSHLRMPARSTNNAVRRCGSLVGPSFAPRQGPLATKCAPKHLSHADFRITLKPF